MFHSFGCRIKNIFAHFVENSDVISEIILNTYLRLFVKFHGFLTYLQWLQEVSARYCIYYSIYLV